MADVRESVMPRQVRIAQWLLYGLALVGLFSAPAVVCGLLALTYGGRARNGVRLTTAGLLVFVVFWAFSQVFDATGPAEFVDAALRIALGLPVLVLLFRPEATAWFDREK